MREKVRVHVNLPINFISRIRTIKYVTTADYLWSSIDNHS